MLFIHRVQRPMLLPQVLGSFGCGALRSHICFCKTTVDCEIGGIDKATLITGEEDDGVGLFDRFTETAGWEMDFATESFLLVVSQPVLQQRCTMNG